MTMQINEAKQLAVSFAAQEHIGSAASVRIYRAKGGNIGVALRDDPEFSDDSLITIAFAQKWDKNTVELRNDSGSTFVKIF